MKKLKVLFVVSFFLISIVSPLHAQKQNQPLRLAMSAAFVSENGVNVYQKIVDYIGQRLDAPTKFVTGLAYSTINEMLKEGVVASGFVCGLPYILAHDKDRPEVHLIAAPVMKAERYQGKPIYFSDIIVRKDSPYQSFADLKGKTFVYNEEISNSGYNMPRYYLVKNGLAGGYFENVLRSGSHEESIRMVAEGAADVSFVDSLVIDFDREMGYGYADQVRVIESVGPAGIPPVVISSQAPQELRDKLQNILINMHKDEQGRAILDQALVDRFVVVSDTNYDNIRHFKQTAETAGYLIIQ